MPKLEPQTIYLVEFLINNVARQKVVTLTGFDNDLQKLLPKNSKLKECVVEVKILSEHGKSYE